MSKLNISFKGKKYSIDKSLLSSAISSLETVLTVLSGGDVPTELLAPGLYQTGAIDLYEEQGASAVKSMMITSWDELLADGTVHVNNGDIYTNYDPNSNANSSYSILVGDLILPNDAAIINFAESAFQGCTKLTGICIPNTTTQISFDAFCNCLKLTSIVVPNSVTDIGDGAFTRCNSMTNVYIADVAAWCNLNLDNQTSNPLSYTRNFYLNGQPLTELVVPEGVTSINSTTFNYCPSLTSVIMPNSVVTVGAWAFNYCSSLTNVVLSSNLVNIERSAFGHCGIKSIVIPETVKNLGDSAFSYCKSLENITFEGTMQQWQSIKKVDGWNRYVPASYVQCSDGQVKITY